MKAVRIHGHGGPEVVRCEQAPEPKPKANEVLVQVKACALNHLDLWVRGGLPGLDLDMPHTLGSDAAVGMALILSLLAGDKRPLSTVAAEFPRYFTAKSTRPIPKNFASRLKRLPKKYIKGKINRIDGIKVFLPDGSLHIRASNTEPIYRVTAEARSAKRARVLMAEGLTILGG